jgi:hypothetical protein
MLVVNQNSLATHKIACDKKVEGSERFCILLQQEY